MKKCIFTEKQREVFDKATLLGELYYEGSDSDISFKPRFYPLLAGPTGAGKTFLGKKLAEKLGAYYIHATYGSWLPQGVEAERGGSTAFRILDLLWNEERVLLHIDELDKLSITYDQSWERSIANDIWSVLDKIFPVENWVATRLASHFLEREDGTPDNYHELICKQKVEKKLWIIGSGTWQRIFDKEHGQQMGFIKTKKAAIEDQIFSIGIIPVELLSRFNSDLLVLNYPSNDEEKLHLLESSGLGELSRKVGIKVSPSMIDCNKNGMRAYEVLACNLLVEERKQRLEQKIRI